MRHLIESVRESVRTRNWDAALALALTLPDIAGWLDGRRGRPRDPFIAWFDEWVRPRYESVVAGSAHVFLSGSDCYALRCAFLHRGDLDITGQSARDALDRFSFVFPSDGSTVHCNREGSVLQLRVDIFCEDVCLGAEAWLAARGSVPPVAEAIAGLPRIVAGTGLRHVGIIPAPPNPADP